MEAERRKLETEKDIALQRIEFEYKLQLEVIEAKKELYSSMLTLAGSLLKDGINGIANGVLKAVKDRAKQ